MQAVNKGYDRIWMISQKEEMSEQVPDRTDKFFKETSSLLSYLSGREILIDTPFRNMDKVEMVKWYVDEGLSIEKLKQTWACYHPDSWDLNEELNQFSECGDCGACFRRAVAFILNGITEKWFLKFKEPDILNRPSFENKTVELYRTRAEEGFYSKKRNQDILNAIKLLQKLEITV